MTLARWCFCTSAAPQPLIGPIALAVISTAILGSIPSPATAIDARCITVSDVVILGGEETMANKRAVQVARLGPLRRGGDGDRGLWRGQHHRGL